MTYLTLLFSVRILVTLIFVAAPFLVLSHENSRC